LKFEPPSEEGAIAEVLCTDGDTHLGGVDFDNQVYDYCLKAFIRENSSKGANLNDITDRSKRRLRAQCEKVKKRLSNTTSTFLDVPFFHKELSLKVQITRSTFNMLCSNLFNKCMDRVRGCLLERAGGSPNYTNGLLQATANDNNLIENAKQQINKVIMVGGSSRVPEIRKMVEGMFGSNKLDFSVHPDEAVALGAGYQAVLLAADADLDASQSILLLDTVPLNLSIETAGGVATTIIKKSTTIPYNHTETFTTYADNQTSVTINVFEGNRPMVKDNHMVGTFNLHGISPAPRGVPKISVTLDVDNNGILTVTAKDEATNNSEKLTVTNMKGRLSQEEIDQMIKDAAKFEESDKKHLEKITARNNLENHIYTVKSLAEKAPNKDELLAKLKEHEDWLMTNPNAEKEEYENKLNEIQEIMKSAMPQGGAGMPPNPDPSQDQEGPGKGPKVEEVD